jgi:endogenous inhibitor of DNA gyrase (YacG/DUF329 family)
LCRCRERGRGKLESPSGKSMKQACAQCGKTKFGLVRQRHYLLEFCSTSCKEKYLAVWYRSESASRAGVDGCTAPDRAGLQFPNLLSIRKFGLDRPHHHAHSFLAARASISTLVKITVLVGGPGGNDAQAGAAAGGTDTYHAGTLDRLEVVSSRHDIAPANLSVRTSGLRWS